MQLSLSLQVPMNALTCVVVRYLKYYFYIVNVSCKLEFKDVLNKQKKGENSCFCPINESQ